jgi:hypothetical protein
MLDCLCNRWNQFFDAASVTASLITTSPITRQRKQCRHALTDVPNAWRHDYPEPTQQTTDVVGLRRARLD